MRNYGLDLIRSVAILLVLVCHGTMFVSQYFDTNGIMYITGYLGVEFFFVLSGFLIGKIIIVDLYESKSWDGLKIFYMRRWLRTLPLYYLIVFFISVSKGSFTWENLFFIQNFSAESLSFNPVSWSLSVEEWFYLVAPCLLLVIARVTKKNTKSLFLGICIVFVMVEMILRVSSANTVGVTWDFGVRKQIFLRLDSIMIGVLLAGIKYYYQDLYARIARSKLLLLISTLVFVYFGILQLYKVIVENNVDQSFFNKTFLFTIISLCISVFIANTEKSIRINTFLSNSIIGKLIRFISFTSYAVYLIHYEIFVLVSSRISNYDTSLPLSFIAVLLVLLFVYILAYILYKYLEKPIMNYRDSKYPSKKGIIPKIAKQGENV